jgi:hypothetical protein
MCLPYLGIDTFPGVLYAFVNYRVFALIKPASAADIQNHVSGVYKIFDNMTAHPVNMSQ